MHPYNYLHPRHSVLQHNPFSLFEFLPPWMSDGIIETGDPEESSTWTVLVDAKVDEFLYQTKAVILNLHGSFYFLHNIITVPPTLASSQQEVTLGDG